MNADTQKHKILQYCETHGSITIRDAFEKLYINSPTKRISELRRCGYDVQTVDESKTNADGVSVTYKRYFIKEADGAAV